MLDDAIEPHTHSGQHTKNWASSFSQKKKKNVSFWLETPHALSSCVPYEPICLVRPGDRVLRNSVQNLIYNNFI